MAGIENWLDKQGLGKYASMFVDNEIEIDDLVYLSEDDLEKLGLPMGPRKRFLAAVQSAQSQSTVLATNNDPETEHRPIANTETGAEHRQLTVMFADLVGSVELGELLDVEDYRDLLSRFRNDVVAAVQRYDGFVARHQGDGLLVYFGYPRAHENDAERAIRAGLAVIPAVRRLDHPYAVEPAVRVGVATGGVIVGDLIEAGGASEFAALGQTPNLAARLQGQAAAHELIVSDTTHRIAGHLFESKALEQLNLKGLSAPVRAFRITAELSSLDRRDGEFSHRLSPMVGRGVELALLEDRWTKTREGHGQIVLIGAEPGVGKSRLLHEFRQKVRADPHVFVALHCSPYQTFATLFPVIDVIERRLKLAKDAGDVARLDALEQWIDALALSRAEYVPLLAVLLEISFESRYAALNLSAQERRRKTLEALVRLIEAQVVDKPMLLIAEDLHWVDPTTEMFLGRIVEIAKNSPINMLLTQRPEYCAPWGSEPHLTEVRLNHLTRNECRSLIGNIAATAGLSESLMENIAERTDGVPLFVEELSKAIVDAQDFDAIPASLRDALTARLDLLGRAKDVAQAASVLGREFSSELLPVILDIPTQQISEGLDALVSSGLVNSIRPVPAGDHQFKHALVRDAAYESLLRPARQQLHQRAADALGNLSSPVRPAIIAHHLEQAGAIEEATERWKQAGEEAARRWAHAEAAAHFRHALDLAEQNGFAAQSQIRLVIRLAHTLHLNGERSQADALMASMSALIPDVQCLSAVGWFYSAWAEISSFLGKRQEAWSHCEKALKAGRESGDRQLIATALVGLSTEDVFTERFRQVLDRNEEALALFSEQSSLVWEADSALSRCLLTLGLAAVRLGEIEKARAALVRVAEIREKLPRTLSERGSGIPALVGIAQGEWDAVINAVEHELRDGPSPFRDAALHYFLSCAVLGRGDVERAVPMLEEGLKKAERYRSEQVQLWAAVALGEGYCDAGRLDDAQDVAIDCNERAQRNQVPDTGAILLRGRVALQSGELDRAYEFISAADRAYASREMKPQRARCHYLLASVASGKNNQSAAFEHLQYAHHIYVDMGARWYAEKTRSLAKQLGLATQFENIEGHSFD